jgi:hypothetical protein
VARQTWRTQNRHHNTGVYFYPTSVPTDLCTRHPLVTSLFLTITVCYFQHPASRLQCAWDGECNVYVHLATSGDWHTMGRGGGDIFGIRPWETMNYGFSLSLLSCLLEVQAAMSPTSDKYPSYASPIKDSMAVKFHIFAHFKSYPYAGLKSPLGQRFSTFVRPRPGKSFFYKTRVRSLQIYS